ncbi:hypothetical protein HQO42_05330 [Rhodococcus fascians]|nr:hypothetical protein [Rhodococcus fascians]MBY4252061.1 hypothetical protein [Rhodococcus fascians]
MILAVFAGFLVVALSVFLVVQHYEPTWDAEQWGPVAAWFSGIATVFAVTISLYQTVRAQREARLTIETNERHHREQIRQSKTQMELQIREARNLGQTTAVTSICRVADQIVSTINTYLLRDNIYRQDATPSQEKQNAFALDRQETVASITQSMTEAQLLRSQVFDHQILEQVEQLLELIDGIIPFINLPLAEAPDYSATNNHLSRVRGRSRVATNMLLLKQPDYQQYIMNKSQPPFGNSKESTATKDDDATTTQTDPPETT